MIAFRRLPLAPAVLVATILLSLHSVASAEDDWDLEDAASTEAVNDGDLRFLPGPVDDGALNVHTRIRVTSESLETGWVQLMQCYRNLDAIPRVELVYRYREMRNLAVIGKRRIGKAEVQGQSVQLEDVARQASICVEAETRNFYREGNAGYLLKNGPYMRRFLDGYYPFHVSLRVDYPGNLIKIAAVTPEAQTGFTREQGDGHIQLEAWFEGELTTAIRFQQVVASPE